jgi:hypothetical protein
MSDLFSQVDSKISAIVADCSTKNLAEIIAKAETVEPALARFAPQVVSETIAERREKALVSCNRILDQGAEELQALALKVEGEKRKTYYPLLSSVSPNKQDLGKYYDQRAFNVVKATFEVTDIQSLESEWREAEAMEDNDYVSRLYFWCGIVWKNVPVPILERLEAMRSRYKVRVDLDRYESTLRKIFVNLEALQNRHALVAQPTLLAPKDFATYEKALRLSGQAG